MRIFTMEHEIAVLRIWNGLLTFLCFLLINSSFGYSEVLNHIWLAVILSVLCAFIPLAGSMFIIMLFLLMNLYALSKEVAMITFGLWLLSYFIGSFYQVKRQQNLVLLPLLQQWGIPYVIPVESGLLGSINEIAGILCGGFLSFYLKIIQDNASMFMDENSNVSAMDLLINQVIGNHLFYFYMIALTILFLVIYSIRYREIHHAWLVAIVSGIISEFAIMLAGFLFTGNQGQVPGLLWGNAVALVVGLLTNFFIRDLDYSRIEKVQYEDDDYYYYVTAVPKLKITEEDKQVKKITDETAGKEADSD